MIEPDDGIASIGAADPTPSPPPEPSSATAILGPMDIALESMKIASELCVFTNGHYTLEVL